MLTANRFQNRSDRHADNIVQVAGVRRGRVEDTVTRFLRRGEVFIAQSSSKTTRVDVGQSQLASTC